MKPRRKTLRTSPPFPWLWVAASLLIHLLIIVPLFVWFTEPSVPGDGAVMVTLGDAGGAAPGGDKSLGTQSIPKTKGTIATPKNSDGGGIGDGAGTGNGEGENGGGASGGGGGGGGNATLAQIYAKIERAKFYPKEARALHHVGTVEIGFKILENGQADTIHIIRSSGSPLLDSAARDAVKRASPLPYYPRPITLLLNFELH